MSDIIKFPGSEEILHARHLNEMLLGLDDLVEAWLKITPPKIEALLSIPLNQISIIENIDDIKQMIFEFIIQKADKKKIPLRMEITQASQYLSNLLFRLWVNQDSEIVETLWNPYYTYWIEQWEPKKAWDISVYNLVFRKDVHKTGLQGKDYISMAANGYAMHSGSKFGGAMYQVLPLVEDFTKENPFHRTCLHMI